MLKRACQIDQTLIYIELYIHRKQEANRQKVGMCVCRWVKQFELGKGGTKGSFCWFVTSAMFFQVSLTALKCV